MSTALAIAATSRVITAIIDDAVAAARHVLPGVLGSATTTTSPPDHIVHGVDNEITNLNLFLYNVTYNQGWREVGLPTRDSNGASIGRAPLGIDLHYLLSAYSAGDYEAQMMLGIGMQALHEVQVLFRDKIRAVFAPPPSNEVDKALATAELADQVELLKITPQQLGTEELSKLWTAFPNEFRVSAAYCVSVVLIETKAPRVAALPVLSRTVTAFPFTEPVVDAADPAVFAFAPGGSLTIAGQNLVGRDTFVQFDGNPNSLQTPALVNGGPEASAPLPPLAAGINTFRIIRQLDLNGAMTTIVQSNVGSFVLQPVIRRDPIAPHPYLLTVGAPDVSFIPPRVTVVAKVDPPLHAGQRAALLFNELHPPANQPPRSFSFDAAPADVVPPDTISVFTQGIPAGDYLVRVRIDGADSPLEIDAVTHQFVKPAVTF